MNSFNQSSVVRLKTSQAPNLIQVQETRQTSQDRQILGLFSPIFIWCIAPPLAVNFIHSHRQSVGIYKRDKETYILFII